MLDLADAVSAAAFGVLGLIPVCVLPFFMPVGLVDV
jgi:hypothetical protein